MDPSALQQKVIETADQYHFTAEEQWEQATNVDPVNDELAFEFRRLVRAALLFYARACLALEMIETDDEQSLEEVLEIASESEPELENLIEQNNGLDVLDEESEGTLSQLFSVAEAIRSLLLQRSNQLAASLQMGNREE